MSRIKDYCATLADAGDGVADMDAIAELNRKREEQAIEQAWKEWDYWKIKKELGL